MDNRFIEQEYRARINRVIDHIQKNIDRKLILADLAKIANFSQFHFHRIFASLVGETLTSFIQRMRIERAAIQLIRNSKKSITEIAFDLGFSSSASFSRLFKASYNMSATQWRNGGFKEFEKISSLKSKNGKTNSNICKDTGLLDSYMNGEKRGVSGFSVENTPERRRAMLKLKPEINVRCFDEMTIAYVRHIGPYQGNSELFGSLWGKLMTWAGARRLAEQNDLKSICIYHDDPDITDSENLQLDVCITVPKDTQVDGDIGKNTIPGGKYAVFGFELTPEDYGDAWGFVFGEWLPQSGYQPDDRPCFEICLNNPLDHPEGKSIVEICIPVKPL